jgi:hypothetical protein
LEQMLLRLHTLMLQQHQQLRADGTWTLACGF